MTSPAGDPNRGAAPGSWRGRCGTAAPPGVNAIVVTFVFSVYLTGQVGAGLPGPTTPASLARVGC